MICFSKHKQKILIIKIDRTLIRNYKDFNIVLYMNSDTRIIYMFKSILNDLD